MLRNYIKIAFRNLWKNKLFSFINIVGLGIAFPFAMLSLLQLRGSFEFDNFHPESDRVFRIITDENANDGGKSKYASSPFQLSEKLKNNYACVEKSTKVVREFGWELSNRLTSHRANSIYIEPSFFEIFGFSLEKGSIPLEPNSVILSHETAEKFFNNINPIGQVLVHPTHGVFKVTGVLKPYKKQTQFKSDVMISMSTYENQHPELKKAQSWADYNTHTFVRIHKNTDATALNDALQKISKETNKDIVFAKKTHQFSHQALADISPSVEKLRNNPYVEDMADIYFNFSIPLMILLLAGFNYTNLTLARSLSRSKEVGVRKVMGALRFQLIFQFICEAIVIAFFAFILGFFILQLMKQFIHVQWVTWEVENQAILWVIFIGFTLFLGIVAGLLPSWVLSGFQPVSVLKGSIAPASFGKINLRKVLIVTQFVVTMGFLFQLGHLFNQFDYMATENENFNRKGVFNISLADKNYQALKDEILKHKDVEKIGFTSMPFGGIATEFAIKEATNAENKPSFYYAADKNFIENMNLKFLAGNNLPTSQSDSAGNLVIINEKAVSTLHLKSPQEAIGKTIFLNNVQQVQVIGVIQDFCHFNYQFEKQPLVFQYNPEMFRVLSVKTNENISKDAFLADMKALWKKNYPYLELGYSWYEDELYDRYYPAEDLKMMGLAGLVILVIAVMGLLGMVTYSTEKRFKEIGIRKVMGATELQVVKILSWSFMKMLIIAGIIALPIGYLESFALDMVFTFYAGTNFYLMALFLAFVFAIALFTIIYYSAKAALVNPVKSLRSE